jgi:hypothetical protein
MTNEQYSEKNKRILIEIQREFWIPLKNYEGRFLISNYGNVKNSKTGIIRKQDKNSSKYYKIDVGKPNGYIAKKIEHINEFGEIKLKEEKYPIIKVHSHMAKTFFNHNPNGTTEFVVDHINNDSLLNNVNNLQIIDHRENIIKEIDKEQTTSKYSGVSKTESNTFLPSISIKGIVINFSTTHYEDDAGLIIKLAQQNMNLLEGNSEIDILKFKKLIKDEFNKEKSYVQFELF